VETLDVGILRRLAGLNVQQLDLSFYTPRQKCQLVSSGLLYVDVDDFVTVGAPKFN
jgi:hypothetical protein